MSTRVIALMTSALATVLVMSGTTTAAQPAAQPAEISCANYVKGISWVAPSTQTLEYGEYWAFHAENRGVGLAVTSTWQARATIDGAPQEAMLTSVYMDYDRCFGQITVFPGDTRPLDPGSYSFTARMYHVVDDADTDVTPEPARLTVTPAQLGLQVRIATDPSNPRNAIITASFTGAFVDRFAHDWGSTSYPQAPLLPEGEWHLTVRDDDGDVVHERVIARTATDDILAVSEFWPDPAAGEYTASATFVPSGPARFTFTDAAPSAFTAAGPPPDAVPTATPAPTGAPAEAAAPTVPSGVILGVGLLSVALAAVLVVQAVRLVRARRSASPDVTEVAE